MGASGSTYRHATYLYLATPVTGYLESKITVQSGSMVLGDGYGYARIGAYFYNSELGPGSYNAYQSNVWGHVKIVLENDNTLKAKASLWKITAPDESAGEYLLDQEFPIDIDFDTEYTVSMELKGTEFIFRCDDEEIIYQIQTPIYEPYEPCQILNTRIYPEEGSAVSLKALFDDVYVVKNVLYDSFDTEFIDFTKWEESDHSVREIDNGKLRMNEYGTTRRFSTYLHLATPVTGYLGAKINVQSGSLVLGDGTGYARIGAYFYNSELGPGSYNAYEGNVWSGLRIELQNDNTLKAKAYLWKSTAPDDGSAGETLLDQEFAKSINFDTEYTISIELSGSQIIFRCDDEKIIYQIQTPVYTPYEPYQHLCTRIYPEEGSAVSLKALFDDVKIDKLPNPDIKANGSYGPVEISNGETLSITIGLDPGIYPGYQADWWVLADTPFGWYYYDAGTEDWLPGFHVSYQGPLFELTPSSEVLNTSELPTGGYTFYFGVDGNRNGNLDEPLYYDSVEVTITP